MGSKETKLFMMYGLPLLIKLISNGKEIDESVATVTEITTSIVNEGMPNVSEKLLNASPEQQASIVDGLFDVIVGIGEGLMGLVKAFSKLLFK